MSQILKKRARIFSSFGIPKMEVSKTLILSGPELIVILRALNLFIRLEQGFVTKTDDIEKALEAADNASTATKVRSRLE